MAELSVQLTANIKSLESQLNKAKRELGQLEGVGVKSNQRLGRSFNTAGKGAANALPALQEFSRVIQDAPFGIQGVGNNIQQLTANFGNLSKSAGGSRAALKLMLGALAGPGGILLAVSAVTSLMTVFAGKLRGASDEAKTLSERLEDLSETFSTDLNINKLQLDILKLQGKEFNTMLIQRKQILATQLSTLTNLLKEEQATLNIAKADEGRLTTFEALNKEAGNLLVKQGALALFLAKTTAQEVLGPYAELFGLLSKGVTVTQEGAEATADETKRISESEAKIKQLQEARLKILKEIAELTRDINAPATTEPILNLDKIFVLKKPLTGIFTDPVRAELKRLGLLLDQTPALVTPKLSNIEQKLADFKARMDAATVDLAAPIAAGFASLGQTLAQGGSLINAIGGAILQTLGGIVTQIGQATIAAGVAALALKGLFDKPGLAIAAGGALVAIGSALSSAQSAVSGIGGGGTGGVGGQGSGSFSGSSSTFSSSGGFGDGTVVFEISGQKLVGVLNRTLNKNKGLGGNLSLN